MRHTNKKFHSLWLKLNALLCSSVVLLAVQLGAGSAHAETDYSAEFTPIPLQFIAALGDPTANSGSGAETWGIWRRDPGKYGVWLHLYSVVNAAGGYTPAGWQLDNNDWWLEEHGLMMEKPNFNLPAGRYLVTGDREVTAVLTISEKDEAGNQDWHLADNAQLFDVTHLPCRSARYRPTSNAAICTPNAAPKVAFPISPGTEMPAVAGCRKQDYAVLFIVGMPTSQSQ